MYLDPKRKHFKLLAFSFSLIQVIPCNYGSIIRGYLSELVKIVPFSIETWSEGSFCLFQRAAVLSVVNNLVGSGFGDNGI